MEKKLPKVFANQINKNFNNNESVYVEKKEKVEEKKSLKPVTGKTINQKIQTIFNSRNYIYKADVEIEEKSGKRVIKVIGKNGNYLITIDNERIPIDSILDIRVVE